MALATSVAGDGILIDKNSITRKFNIWVGLTLQEWEETTTTETREWVALTRSAAQTYVDDAAPHPSTGTYTYSMSESQRYVGADGSYSVKRLEEIKTYAQV